MRWPGRSQIHPGGSLAGKDSSEASSTGLSLAVRSPRQRGAAPRGAAPRPISRHGCRTGGAPGHPRSRARTRRSSGRPLRGHDRQADVRARPGAARALFRRRSSICSGEMGSPYSLMPRSPAAPNPARGRTDGRAGRSHDARSKGNLPDNAPPRPGPSKRCSRRRARRCLVLTVAAGMPSVSATSPTSSSSIWRSTKTVRNGAGSWLIASADNLPDLPARDRTFGRHGHRAAHQHFAIIVQDGDFTLLEQ